MAADTDLPREDGPRRRARRRLEQARALPEPAGVKHWHERLSELKSLVLLGGGAAYVLGYLARALHAWSESLGVLPALDFQYFVAGLLMGLPLAALVLATLGVRLLLRRWVAWEAARRGRRETTNRWLGTLQTVGLFGVVLAAVLDDWVAADLEPVVRALGGLLVAAFVAYVVLVVSRDEGGSGSGLARPRRYGSAVAGRELPAGRSRATRVLSAVSRSANWLMGVLVMAYLALVVVAVVGVTMLLGLVWLPLLPQELGGAKPRCLVLDIDTRQLSAPLVADLFDGAAAPESGGPATRRTRGLAVHFSGNDLLLLRVKDAPKAAARTIELRRDAVVATTTCTPR